MGAIEEYRARREARLAKARSDRVDAYKARRFERLIARGKVPVEYRSDAPEEEKEQNNQKGGGSGGESHGNTRLPFGLCKRYGIEIDPSWGPREAWDALAGKGITPEGAFEKLKKGEDPGGVDTPEPPKEPVKRIKPDGYYDTEYEDLKGSRRAYVSRGADPWILRGKRIGDGVPGRYWPPPTMSKSFATKMDMFAYLKEHGVEEFADPETGEIINPKEMELPKTVGKAGGVGYTALALGLRDGRYFLTGTDYDGKKKKLDDFRDFSGAKKFIEDMGATVDDVKMSPALKKREKERVAWMTSDKKEYFTDDEGRRYGDVELEPMYGGWAVTGESESGEKTSVVFHSRARAMEYLKKQGVEKAREGKESLNPMEFEMPEVKATVDGEEYSDIGLKADKYGFVTMWGTDLDGESRTIAHKYSSETVEEFKQRIGERYGVGSDQLTIPEDSREKLEEMRKEEEWRDKLRKEWEAKAIDVGGRKYSDVHIETDDWYGRDYFAIYGYDKDGRKRSITTSGDLYDMEKYADQYGLDMNKLIQAEDTDIREKYDKYLKLKEDFEKTAVDFAGDKYADVQITYDGGKFEVMGKDGRGRDKEIARGHSYEELEKVLDWYGYTPTSFPMDGDASKAMDRAKRAKYAISTGEYYGMGKTDMAFKDIRVEEDPDVSRTWKVIGTDIDGNEKIIETHSTWDEAIDAMGTYGVRDYKLKDRSGAEMQKPTDGMHGVMIVRKPGGGFAVYADSDTRGKHAVVYETDKESDARKWIRDNNIPEGGVKTRGMNPNDDVVRNPPTKAMKNFDTHRMKAIEGTFIDDMTDGEKQEAAEMLTELFKQGEYRVARSTDSFLGILENGYKSQIETGTGGYGASKNKELRKRCSEQMYGHGKLEKSEYEKMGYIAPADIAEDYDSGDHPFYGGDSSMTYTLKKDALKDRTTYTFGDSLNTYSSGYGSLKSAGYAGENPTIEGLTGIGGKRYMDRALEKYRAYKRGEISFSTMFSNLRSYANNEYIELQFTGPVTAKDIQKVSFDKESRISDAFEKMTSEERKRAIQILRDNNIEIEYRPKYGAKFVDAWDWIKKHYPDDV